MSLRALFTSALVAVPLLVAVPAGPATADGHRTSFVEPLEYGANERHDPFDYSQATDLMTDRDVNVGVHDFRHLDGRVRFSTTPSSTKNDWYISPVWMTFPHHTGETQYPDSDGGALHDQYDGLAMPIDANRYTHLSLRFHVDADPGLMYLSWFGCQEWLPDCQGLMRLDNVTQGWNTVILPIERSGSSGLPKEWAGHIYGVRLQGVADTDPTYTLDWFRLYDGGAPEHQLSVDAAANRFSYSNQPDPATAMGTLTPTGTSAPMQVDVGGLPPGTWYIFDEGSQVGRVTVTSRPRPEILDPDMAGGADYATEVLGNPWDFEDASDVVAVRNSANVRFSGGELSAQAVPTAPAPRGNDPYVILPLSGDGLDPVHYHRVSVDQHYDAEFNLNDAANPVTNPRPGGSHGRLVWRTPNHHETTTDCRYYSDGREFVFFKTWDAYTYDMRYVPAAQGNQSSAEPNMGVPGCQGPDPHWTANGPLTFLRFDPHEAPDDYRWYLRDLRIAADDAADPTFDITWRDPQAIPGTQVTVRLDGDRSGHDGEVVYRGGQQAGANRVTFDATDRLPGTYWVNITSRAPDGSVGRDYATGPLQVSPRIAGADRVQTAVEVSRQSFDAARTAVVASARDFPDALVAVQLADAVGGPVLLTEPSSLPGSVAEELDRLGVDEVVVAGGEVAVSARVARALGEDGRSVTRLGGATRYETSVEIARATMRRRGTSSASRVLVTTGENFPDALAAGPFVGHGDLPLVLARPEAPPPPPPSPAEDGQEPPPQPPPPPPLPDNGPAKAFLDRVGAAEVTFIGGPVALSDRIVADVRGSRDGGRIAGGDRFATARRLADAAVDAGGSTADVLVATGRNFPDALSAGPAALARGGVLALTEKDGVPGATRDWLAGVGGGWSSWRVVGGPVAVSHATVRGLRSASDL